MAVAYSTQKVNHHLTYWSHGIGILALASDKRMNHWKMTAQVTEIKEFYDKIALAMPKLYYLNFGFSYSHSICDEDISPDSEYYCNMLYEHVFKGYCFDGKVVIDIGCGHGGGAYHISTANQPKHVVGLDISIESLHLCKKQFSKLTKLDFILANAMEIPMDDSSCEIAINIESAHAYPCLKTFFNEVYRILTPGGLFFFSDFTRNINELKSYLTGTGLSIMQYENITDNVIMGMELDSKRRTKWIENSFPESLHERYKHWAGVKDYGAYKLFKVGELRYYKFILAK